MDWNDFCLATVDEDFNAVPDNILKERIRAWRREELSATDFTQLPDSPKDAQVWATYRQAIRDLPEQSPDPRQWVFPSRPA